MSLSGERCHRGHHLYAFDKYSVIKHPFTSCRNRFTAASDVLTAGKRHRDLTRRFAIQMLDQVFRHAKQPRKTTARGKCPSHERLLKRGGTTAKGRREGGREGRARWGLHEVGVCMQCAFRPYDTVGSVTAQARVVILFFLSFFLFNSPDQKARADDCLTSGPKAPDLRPVVCAMSFSRLTRSQIQPSDRCGEPSFAHTHPPQLPTRPTPPHPFLLREKDFKNDLVQVNLHHVEISFGSCRWAYIMLKSLNTGKS